MKVVRTVQPEGLVIQLVGEELALAGWEWLAVLLKKMEKERDRMRLIAEVALEALSKKKKKKKEKEEARRWFASEAEVKVEVGLQWMVAGGVTVMRRLLKEKEMIKWK